MDLIRQMTGVFAVLFLLGATLWWLRKKGLARFAGSGMRMRAGRHLELIERLALTPHHSLHLVRVGGRALLIGLSASSCTLVESSEWRSLDENRSLRASENRAREMGN